MTEPNAKNLDGFTLKKDTCFKNCRFHTSMADSISHHIPQYLDITIRIARNTVLRRIDLLDHRWLGSSALKSVAFSVQVATNNILPGYGTVHDWDKNYKRYLFRLGLFPIFPPESFEEENPSIL